MVQLQRAIRVGFYFGIIGIAFLSRGEGSQQPSYLAPGESPPADSRQMLREQQQDVLRHYHFYSPPDLSQFGMLLAADGVYEHQAARRTAVQYSLNFERRGSPILVSQEGGEGVAVRPELLAEAIEKMLTEPHLQAARKERLDWLKQFFPESKADALDQLSDSALNRLYDRWSHEPETVPSLKSSARIEEFVNEFNAGELWKGPRV